MVYYMYPPEYNLWTIQNNIMNSSWLGILRLWTSDEHAAQLWRAATGAKQVGTVMSILTYLVTKETTPVKVATENLVKKNKKITIPTAIITGVLGYVYHSWQVWREHCKLLPDEHFADPKLNDPQSYVETFFWESAPADAEYSRPLRPGAPYDSMDPKDRVPGAWASGILWDAAKQLWVNQPQMTQDAGVKRAFNYRGQKFFTIDLKHLRIGGWLVQDLTVGMSIGLISLGNTMRHYAWFPSWNFNLTPKTDVQEKELRFTTYYGCINTALFLHMEITGHIVMKRCRNFYCQNATRQYHEVVMYLDHQLYLTYDRTVLTESSTAGKSIDDYQKEQPTHANESDPTQKVKWDSQTIAMASNLAWDEDYVLDTSKPLPTGTKLYLPGVSSIVPAINTQFKTMKDIEEYPLWKGRFTNSMWKRANPVVGVADGKNPKKISGTFDISYYLRHKSQPLPTNQRIFLPLGQLTHLTTAFTRFNQKIAVETFGSAAVLPWKDIHAGKKSGHVTIPEAVSANGVWEYPPTATDKDGNEYEPWRYKNMKAFDKEWIAQDPILGGRYYYFPKTNGGSGDQRALPDCPNDRADQAFLIPTKAGVAQASCMAKSILSMFTHGPIHFWANGTSMIPESVWPAGRIAHDVTQYMNTKAVFGSYWFIGDTVPVVGSMLALNNSNGIPLHAGVRGETDDIRNIGGARSEFHRMARDARWELKAHFEKVYKEQGRNFPASLQHNIPIVDAVLAGTSWHSADHWNIHYQFSMEVMLHPGKSDLSGLWTGLIKPNSYLLRPDILVRNHVRNSFWDFIRCCEEDPVCRILWTEAVKVNKDFADNALSLGCAY